MGQRTRQALKRPFGVLFSAVLMMLVITACGSGDEDDATQTEDVSTADLVEVATPGTGASTSEAETEIGTPPLLEPVTSSPADGIANITQGTPTADTGGSASPTPAIVVSAPPVQMPTQAPQIIASPGAGADATPASGLDLPGLPGVTGDGTGGAPVGGGDDEAADADGEDQADVAVSTTVESCQVDEIPPYTGDQPVQVTTEDVNFRSGPGTDCDLVFDEPLGVGAVAEVLSDPVTREGEPEFTWVAINIDGTVGWIVSDFLEPVE